MYPLLNSLHSLFLQNPSAQLVGIIALVIGVSAFLQKNDQLLRRNLTIYTLLMGFHFMLLDLWASAITAWLGTIRTYISMRTRNVWVMLGFISVVLILAIPNAQTVVDYLPIAGTTFGTWAMFRETGIRMRLLMFLGTLCWLSHNFLVGSIGGTIIESIFLGVNATTMWKLFKLNRSLPH
jgi:hypothetical protein